jgi:hypothetical protein
MTSRPRHGRQSRGDRDHHIAAVAHHFLAGDGAPAGHRPGAAVLVAAAAPLPVTAFVAAGAARSAALAAGARWGLLEDPAAVWSAATHLPTDDWVLRLDTREFDRLRHRQHGLCWHLGAVSAEHLDAWAGATGLPGCALPTADRPTHLFWCVAAEDAAALSELGRLARLADLATPGRVDLIVAPRSWPRRPTAAGPMAWPPPATVERLRARATDLVGLPVGVGTVTAGMSGTAAAAVVTDLVRAREDR